MKPFGLLWKILFFPVFILSGCNENRNMPDAGWTLVPDEDTEPVSDIAPYIEKMELIKIADDDRLLFSDVAKMLLDDEGRLFILDYTGNLVTMNPDGTFFRKIADRGRASNEYIGIVDIALADGELFILDGSKVRAFGISDAGSSRVLDVPIESPCDAMAPDGAGGLYLYSAFPSEVRDYRKDKDNLLYRVGSRGELEASYVRRTDCTFSMSNISQSSGNTYYLRPQDNGHVFSRLTETGPKPVYRIDFKGKTIPERYYFDAAGEDIMKYMMSDYYKLPMDLHETDTHLYFHAAGPGASDCIFIYDRGSGKGIRWTNAPGSVTVPVPVLASDGDWFYTIFPEIDPDMGKDGDILFRFIVSELEKRGAPISSGPYIVKFNFRHI